MNDFLKFFGRALGSAMTGTFNCHRQGSEPAYSFRPSPEGNQGGSRSAYLQRRA